MIEKLLKPPEAAKVLQVSVATLRNWRRMGRGPTVTRLSKRSFRYSQEAIREFVETVRKSNFNVK